MEESIKKREKQCFKYIFPLLFGLVPTALHAVEYDLSGFSRVVAGAIDKPDVSYFGYKDSFTLTPDSLIGGQAKVDFSKQWSATVLGLKRASSKVDSGIEWLYLTYKPTEALQFKLGRMQTPFFALSDVQEVGYAYPWVSAPKEVYNDFTYKHLKGMDARYAWVANGYTVHLEGYYGEVDGGVGSNTREFENKARDLMGIIFELDMGGWSYRASGHTMNMKAVIPEKELLENEFKRLELNDSANQLGTAGRTNIYQISAEYNSLSYFFKGEYTRTAMVRGFFPKVEGYYLTLGYYYGDFTTHLTYSARRDSSPTYPQELYSSSDPYIQELANQYTYLMTVRTEDDIDSWTLGTRWDFRPNMALKAEFKHIKSANPNSTTFVYDHTSSFDNSANMLSMAWEWLL